MIVNGILRCGGAAQTHKVGAGLSGSLQLFSLSG